MNLLNNLIWVAAGGSGGHLYPAWSFIQALTEHQPQAKVILAVDERGKNLLGHWKGENALPCELVVIPQQQYLGARSLFFPGFWFGLVRSFLKTWSLMKKKNPQVVVGFGGYASFSSVAVGCLLKKKTMIHEQNVLWGLANRLLLPWVDEVCGAMVPKKLPGKKVFHHIGTPLRQNLKTMDSEEALTSLGLSSKKRTLLIFGGSHGSRFLNERFWEFLKVYDGKLKDAWQWIWVTGSFWDVPDQETVERFESCLKIFKYVNSMDLLYQAADVALCRAGSSTLHELSFFKKPAILVPYPYARAHQVKNAQYVQENAGAVMIEESDWTAEEFALHLLTRFSDDATCVSMGKALRGCLQVNGRDALAELVLKKPLTRELKKVGV